jgi:hypothetical protein
VVSSTTPSSASRRAIELVPTFTSPPDRTRGIDIPMSAMTTAMPTPTAQRRGVFGTVGEGGAYGRSRSTGSTPSGTTRETATGSASPFRVSGPSMLVPDAVDPPGEVGDLT